LRGRIFFFFFLACQRDKNGHWGWLDLSPPGRWGGSQPPPVARSISLSSLFFLLSFFFFLFFFFFFFLCHSPERRKWPLGVVGSLSPGRWGGSRPLLVAGSSSSSSFSFSLFFFFFFCVRRKCHQRWQWVAASVRRRWAVGDYGWRHLGTGCFDFILNLCIFLKRLRCQLMSGEQKTLLLCHDSYHLYHPSLYFHHHGSLADDSFMQIIYNFCYN
jgi:hypothetical protein